MGLFDNFPYTNFHELNLMWILEALKEIQTTTEQFVAINSLKYADPIQWNIVQQYEKNTIVIDPLTGTAYISVQPVPSGVALTNTDYWTVVFDLGSFVTRAAKNFTNRWEEATTLTATFPTLAGEWLVWGDTLYKALVNITAGDQYVVDSNIQHFTMEDVIGHLEDLTTTDKSNIVAAINEVLQKLINTAGDLDDLSTTDKSNLVAAINEVLQKLIDTAGDLDDLTTEDKSNLVAAISEVADNQIYYNVKLFGATGDGVTDDSTAIQAAIQAAKAARGVVYFPAGRYYIASMLIAESVTIKGTSTFDNVGAIDAGSIIVIKDQINAIRVDNDVTIEGMAFDYPDMQMAGADPTSYPATIRLYGSVSQFRIHDCAFYSCYIAISDKDKYGYGMGRMDISNIYAYPVLTFLRLSNIADFVYCTNVFLSYAYGAPVGNTARATTTLALAAWTQVQGRAFDFDTKLDAFHMVNSFIFKYAVGVYIANCETNMFTMSSNLIDSTPDAVKIIPSGGGSNHVYNAIIADNTFLAHGVASDEAMVAIHNSDGSNNPDINICNNILESMDRNGIVLENFMNARVSGNIIRSVTETAIVINGPSSGGDLTDVVDNIILGVNNSSSNGISITGEDAIIIGNNINTVNYPAYTNVSKATVVANTIRNNTNAMALTASIDKKVLLNDAAVQSSNANVLHVDYGSAIAAGTSAYVDLTVVGAYSGCPFTFEDVSKLIQYGLITSINIVGANTVRVYLYNASSSPYTISDQVINFTLL